jgi:hypothetical protein
MIEIVMIKIGRSFRVDQRKYFAGFALNAARGMYQTFTCSQTFAPFCTLKNTGDSHRMTADLPHLAVPVKCRSFAVHNRNNTVRRLPTCGGVRHFSSANTTPITFGELKIAFPHLDLSLKDNHVSCTIRGRLNPRYNHVAHLGCMADILNRTDLFACAIRQLCLDEQPKLAEQSHKGEYMVFLPDGSVRYFSTQNAAHEFLADDTAGNDCYGGRVGDQVAFEVAEEASPKTCELHSAEPPLVARTLCW